MLNQKQFGCLKFLSVKHNWKFKKQKFFLFAKQKFPARQTTSGTPVQIRKIRTTVRIWVFTDRLSTNLIRTERNFEKLYNNIHLGRAI